MFFGIAFASWYRAPTPTFHDFHFVQLHVPYKHNTIITDPYLPSERRENVLLVRLGIQEHALLSHSMADWSMRTGNPLREIASDWLWPCSVI
jgi:hypothetical protein